jgi:hypothetical protein
VGAKMKIFLSYASDNRNIAEPIALTLRARGHQVFLDKDDLPTASSYDLQIARAVAECDLMIYLISPSSVKQGRYTLTELSFARKRWPSAVGRVIPVQVAETPLADIPAYLKSVQILVPVGNAAAEVAVAVDDIIPTAKPAKILPFALLAGIASGAATCLLPGKEWGEMISSILPESLHFSFVMVAYCDIYSLAPWLFAIVIFTLFLIWDNQPLFRIIFVFPIILISWGSAYNIAYNTVLVLDSGKMDGLLQGGAALSGRGPIARFIDCDQYINLSDSEKDSYNINQIISSENQSTKVWIENKMYGLIVACKSIEDYRDELKPHIHRFKLVIYVFAGLSAGFIGALFTMLGLRMISTRLRSLDAITLVTLTGMLAGSLLVTHVALGKPELNFYAMMLLFVVWQALVATGIAFQFTRPIQRSTL